ncbi:YlcI/YnfO family protein [Cronobacter dublinensis]|uniref:YlcI/YnfO family protein n=1 Tax=Cronobacter dublinensis TaxID=413497 RepID=UPI000A2ED9FA|nr:YlcI/YnfO family protein [Cronobacter dublinensis]MDI7272333.1 YlcI/YnfO family protein [Cronobacter dublinensis]
MATKAINGKSPTLAACVPHEIVREMQKVRKEGESIGQFVVEALRKEIENRK